MASVIKNLFKDYDSAVADSNSAEISNCLERISESSPDSDHLDLFISLSQERRLSTILEVMLSKFLKETADGPMIAYVTLANLQLARGNRQEAQMILKKLQYVNKHFDFEQWDFVDALFNVGLYEDCILCLQTIKKKKNLHFGFLILLCRSYWATSEKTEAIKTLHLARDMTAEKPSEILWLAAVSAEFKQKDLCNAAFVQLHSSIKNRKSTLEKKSFDALMNAGRKDLCSDLLNNVHADLYHDAQVVSDLIEGCLSIQAFAGLPRLLRQAESLQQNSSLAENVRKANSVIRFLSVK